MDIMIAERTLLIAGWIGVAAAIAALMFRRILHAILIRFRIFPSRATWMTWCVSVALFALGVTGFVARANIEIHAYKALGDPRADARLDGLYARLFVTDTATADDMLLGYDEVTSRVSWETGVPGAVIRNVVSSSNARNQMDRAEFVKNYIAAYWYIFATLVFLRDAATPRGCEIIEEALDKMMHGNVVDAKQNIFLLKIEEERVLRVYEDTVHLYRSRSEYLDRINALSQAF